MQIKGNFDLTVVFTGVAIPTTLREIGWPKASFAKASFSQFWSTIPSHACQLLEIRTWVHETWGKWRNERNVQWTLHIMHWTSGFEQGTCGKVLLVSRVFLSVHRVREFQPLWTSDLRPPCYRNLVTNTGDLFTWEPLCWPLKYVRFVSGRCSSYWNFRMAVCKYDLRLFYCYMW